MREILKISGGDKVLTCGDIFFNLLNSLAAALRAFSGSSAALEDILRQFVCSQKSGLIQVPAVSFANFLSPQSVLELLHLIPLLLDIGPKR